jgi:hypothetical protein
LEAGLVQPKASFEGLNENVIDEVNFPAQRSAREGGQQKLIEPDQTRLPFLEDANAGLPLNKHWTGGPVS